MLRTPLRESSWLSTFAGGTVRLKLETLQPTFSYKIRGAFNTILRLIEEHPDQRQPLVTASAGNHGSALARAARFGRFPLIVYASASAPKVKLDAMTPPAKSASRSRRMRRPRCRRDLSVCGLTLSTALASSVDSPWMSRRITGTR